jgi:hypothetical protein
MSHEAIQALMRALNFLSIYLILPAAIGAEVYLASNISIKSKLLWSRAPVDA